MIARAAMFSVLACVSAAATPVSSGADSNGPRAAREKAPSISVPPPAQKLVVYFLLDASGSMNKPFSGEIDPKIAKVRTYVREAVLSLASHPGVSVLIRAFGPAGCGSVLDLGQAGLGSTKKAIMRIASMWASGPSSLASALVKAEQELSTLQGDKFLVILSDGEDKCGGDITEIGLNSSTKRHVLGLGVDPDTGGRLLELGDYTEVKTSDDLVAALSRIVGDILGSTDTGTVHSTSRYLGTPNKSLSTSSK